MDVKVSYARHVMVKLVALFKINVQRFIVRAVNHE